MKIMRKRKTYPIGYAEQRYEKINKNTFLWLAMFSIVVFLTLIGWFIYKNYYMDYEYYQNMNSYLYLLSYQELLFSLLTSIACFISLSISLLIYKKSLLKKLPQDYFIKKHYEEKSKQRIQAKINYLSIRKKNKLFFIIIGLLLSLITFYIVFLIFILSGQNFSYIEIGVGILTSLLLGTIFSFLFYAKNSSDLENLQWQVSINDIEENMQIVTTKVEGTSSQINNIDTENVKQSEDYLTNLFQTNQRYSIAYNELTRKQADKSFWLAVFSSIIGVILIALGIILLYFKETNHTYVSTSGGVLTEIISAVFLYFHTNTIKSMNKYHNKLLLSQNISIALKITDTLPSEIQNSTRAKLSEQLVNDINKCISFDDE